MEVNPFESPQTAPEPTPAEASTESAPRTPRTFEWSVACLVISVVTLFTGSFLWRLVADDLFVPIVCGVSMAGAALGFVLSAITVLITGTPGQSSAAFWVSLLLLMPGQALMTFVSLLAFVMSGRTGGRGRELRRWGKSQLPRVAPQGEAWSESTDDGVPKSPAAFDGASESLRAATAARWRENGRTEHASIASFGVLTLDLLAVGAPPHLIASAQAATLDEIRHAELCFSLARAIDGQAQGPVAFPQAAHHAYLPLNRKLALIKLAVDSLIQGALKEGTSARTVAKVALACKDPELVRMLKIIAADEGRHARHGWDIVDWCVQEGGEPVRQALLWAAAAIPRRDPPKGPQVDWLRYGLHTEAQEAAAFEATREHMIARLASLQSAECT